MILFAIANGAINQGLLCVCDLFSMFIDSFCFVDVRKEKKIPRTAK